MNKFKKQMKKFGRQLWELFKASIPAALMYFCAGSVLLMLTMKGEEKLVWDNTKLLWTIVCIVAAAVYNGFLAYAQGGNGYEMLVSGNVRRSSEDRYGTGYKISAHKECKEFRYWKGFAVGGFIAIWTIAAGFIFGCNQAAIDSATTGKGLAVMVIVCFLLSGWSILPLYYLNSGGVSVSYFLSLPFALIPIVITGVMYIVGAYGRRRKTIRQQELADKAAQAEASREKKINYGGLPGTKPKKRK